jgi:hypothetical protein
LYLRTLLALPLLLAACSSQRDTAAVQPTAEPIFRYVNLGPLGEFELGEPFGDYARLAVSEGANTYRLRDEAFGGAESIVVTTDDGGIVRRISFEYGPGYAWPEKLANYTESLGPPSEASDTEAVWNDGQTEFSLSREAGSSYAARAEMRDLTAAP